MHRFRRVFSVLVNLVAAGQEFQRVDRFRKFVRGRRRHCAESCSEANRQELVYAPGAVPTRYHRHPLVLFDEPTATAHAPLPTAGPLHDPPAKPSSIAVRFGEIQILKTFPADLISVCKAT